MSEETVTKRELFPAPFGREIRLESVDYESGLRLLRLRIREGRRFTVMDIDEETARRWSAAMSEWADETS
jgi:hypothetical protein